MSQQAAQHRGAEVVGKASTLYDILCDPDLDPRWQAIRHRLGNDRRLRLKACSAKHWQIVAPDRILNIWPSKGGTFKVAHGNGASRSMPDAAAVVKAFRQRT